MRSAGYNPPQRMMHKGSLWAVVALMCVLPAARAANWEQPSADLAKQIAALAGPGPAKLILRNDSSLASAEIPVIRRLLERDLRGFGVVTGGSESATLIRITLSENLRGGLWVAEVVEGTETRVTMLQVSMETVGPSAGGSGVTLRRSLVITEADPVLDAQIFSIGGVQKLVVLEPERIVTYERNAAALVASGSAQSSWMEDQRFAIAHTRAFPRDIRGELMPAQDHLFDAYLPGVLCSSTGASTQIAVGCSDSDDPWPISTPGSGAGSSSGSNPGPQRAFYNALRDYFTGVLAPGVSMELPPFYQAADFPRPTGTALLLNGLDGRVMLIENNILKPVSGANDWGSDFAVIRSGCGSGVQVLVSGSGAAATGDSLRAYEIAGREAIAVSAPVTVEGAVVAIHTANGAASEAASATVIVRRDAPTRYEVWNVAALCN